MLLIIRYKNVLILFVVLKNDLKLKIKDIYLSIINVFKMYPNDIEILNLRVLVRIEYTVYITDVSLISNILNSTRKTS